MFAGVVFNIPVSKAFSYAVPEAMDVRVGCRVRAEFGRRSLIGYVVEVRGDLAEDVLQTGLSADKIKEVSSLVDAEPVFTRLQIDLAEWMAKMYFSNVGECLGTMVPSGKRERAVVIGEEESFPQADLVLSDEQVRAVEAVVSVTEGSFYLAGMTGSGKTEVYLRIAKNTIDEGRGVVYLVPEIALTAQVAALIRSRFGSDAAVLHSRLTPSQRIAEWRRVVRGEARIVVGARSAVFAPVPRLGLIIVDEEHEASYKSQNSPRYHARQIAMRRASTEHARLVMGSATPSAEAFYLMESGRLERLMLSKRIAGGELPRVRIVDIARNDGCLSPELTAEMERTKLAGKQTILFLNRRGFSYFFHCRSCGADLKCRHCSASLTYHKSRNTMICHYCGYQAPPPQICPNCGSLDVGYAGFGTEHVEEAVKARFPDWRIERLDTDTAQKKGHLETTLRDFRDRKIDVLLGTQMIAKGLNFPGVRLVGIVLADSGLHMPDFRSAERTFSLITQVSGRAGRFAPDGTVIIQTMNPKSLPIVYAAEGRSDAFYSSELEARQGLGFPPFGRLIRILVRGKKKASVASCAERLAAELEAAAEAVRRRRRMKAADDGENDSGVSGSAIVAGSRSLRRLEILGPAEAPLGMLAGNHRIHILVSGTDFNEMHHAVSLVLERVEVPSSLYLEVDVDPVYLM